MYEKRDYSGLIGIPGISEKSLITHLALYEGYVNNINKLNDLLVEMEKAGDVQSPEFAELNRRFGWEWNGMRLHEYYFGGLTKGGKDRNSDSELDKNIVKSFGSFESWKKDFISMGMMRGIGWVILYYDKIRGELFNVWIDQHDQGHLAGASPIIALDVFEHAYMIDYGKDRAPYIDAFLNNLDWAEIEKRFIEG